MDPISEKVQQLFRIFEQNGSQDLTPLFPLLSMRRKPLDITRQFMFRHRTRLTGRPRRSIDMMARQVGKSTTNGGGSLIKARVLPDYKILSVLPRFDQVLRFRNEVVAPLFDSSPCKQFLIDPGKQLRVNHIPLLGDSDVYYDFAFMSSERLRGHSGICEVHIDEIQDFDHEFIPVLGETMSARHEHGYYVFTGTAKSFANTAQKLWEESSQGEWVVRCPHCNKHNIACSSEDLWNMIGKRTVVCAKCSRPLDCSTGTYVHRYPDRRTENGGFEGRHFPQITHPFHYMHQRQWLELLRKLNKYPEYRIYNEVFGEAFDSESRLLTEPELQAASRGHANSLKEFIQTLRSLDPIVIGIDWSGGGGEHSYTAVAAGGRVRGSDALHVGYGIKMPLDLSIDDQINVIQRLYAQVKGHASGGQKVIVAHDYTGAGDRNHKLLMDAGVPQGAIMPLSYTVLSGKAVMVFHKPSKQIGTRASFSLDKPRSLMILALMLKSGKVRLPNPETTRVPHCDNKPLYNDLLPLYTETKERPTGSDLFLVRTEGGQSDDWAHALNFMCSACWFMSGEYPRLDDVYGIAATEQAVTAASRLKGNEDWLKLE